jgi:hypothetical protein
MAHLGDFALETTVYAKFCTVTTTGAPTVLAGSPVVSVYENDDNTQITAGVTLNVDEDGVVGLNQLVIAATAANGYEVGKFYDAVITTGTVGGTSVVGYCVASFTIEATAALRPTTNGRELDVSAGGEAGVDWANVGSPTSTVGLTNTTVGIVTLLNGLAANIITAAATAADFGTEIGTAVWATAARTLTAATNITSTGGTTVPQTGDSFARLGVPAGASVSADIAVINAAMGGIAQTGDAYAIVASPTFGNAALKTIADNIPTNAELATAITAGVAGTPAAVLAAATAAPIAANIEQINTVTIVGDGSGTPFNV